MKKKFTLNELNIFRKAIDVSEYSLSYNYKSWCGSTFISLLYLQLDSSLIICVFLSFTSLFHPQIWT